MPKSKAAWIAAFKAELHRLRPHMSDVASHEIAQIECTNHRDDDPVETAQAWAEAALHLADAVEVRPHVAAFLNRPT